MRYLAVLAIALFSCGKVDSQLPETGPVYLMDPSDEDKYADDIVKLGESIVQLNEEVQRLQGELSRLLQDVESGTTELAEAQAEIDRLRFLVQFHSIEKVFACENQAFYVRISSFFAMTPFGISQKMADQIYERIPANTTLLESVYKYESCLFEINQRKVPLTELQQEALQTSDVEIPVVQICWSEDFKTCHTVLEGTHEI